jgi:hypothetical protein
MARIRRGKEINQVPSMSGKRSMSKVSGWKNGRPRVRQIGNRVRLAGHGRATGLGDGGQGPGRRERSPWRQRGTVLTLLGLVIAIISGVMAIFAWLLPQSAPSSPSDLRIESIGINRLQSVDIESKNAGMSDPSSKAGESAIDIVIHNDGNSSGLIRSIDAHFDYAQALENCNPGHGPVVVTGNYSMLVPVKPSGNDFVLSKHDALFQVAPNSYDSLSVTIGPERMISGDYPWIYGVTLVLHTESPQQELKTEHVSFISPTSYVSSVVEKQIDRASPSDVPCMQKNADMLSKVSGSNGRLSPQITDLLNKYKTRIELITGHP